MKCQKWWRPRAPGKDELFRLISGHIVRITEWMSKFTPIYYFYFLNILLRHCLLVVNSCRMQTAAALRQKKESLFKGKTDSDPCFWQRTKGLSGDQVTAMWHWGISVLHSLWLNITVADRESCRPALQFRRHQLHWTPCSDQSTRNHTVILHEGNMLLNVHWYYYSNTTGEKITTTARILKLTCMRCNDAWKHRNVNDGNHN